VLRWQWLLVLRQVATVYLFPLLHIVVIVVVVNVVRWLLLVSPVVVVHALLEELALVGVHGLERGECLRAVVIVAATAMGRQSDERTQTELVQAEDPRERAV
jgi:hypothetical protein